MHIEINHSDEPIRLFKSDFMEFFTHISPVAIVVVWAPVAIFFFYRAVANAGGKFPLSIPLGFLLGLFVWTITEYTMHRFVFHFRPKSSWQERVSFLFHGVHHAQPQCKTRLVMPFPVSIPLALLFYGLFYLVLNVLLGTGSWVNPAFSGFMVGYLAYDLTHYATHHFPMRSGYVKYLKRHHLKHHYKTPDQRYGVSTTAWDMVFGTYPEDGGA
ncbi:MAG: sterol desaturase family protein [Anaerolineaceae bacterium]|nr:sterol desaturase family protein [Anaerolineaceae bacterium]